MLQSMYLLKEHLNYHDQTVSRNRNFKDTGGDGPYGNELDVNGN